MGMGLVEEGKLRLKDVPESCFTDDIAKPTTAGRWPILDHCSGLYRVCEVLTPLPRAQEGESGLTISSNGNRKELVRRHANSFIELVFTFTSSILVSCSIKEAMAADCFNAQKIISKMLTFLPGT